MENTRVVVSVPTVIETHAICDKCSAPRGSTYYIECSLCVRQYWRCEKCGGARGVKRSLHSHRALYHTGESR